MENRNDSRITYILHKYNCLIETGSFGTYRIKNEQDESNLKEAIVKVVAEAQQTFGRIINTSNYIKQEFYNSLVNAGILEFVKKTEAKKDHSGFSPTVFFYKCLVSVEEIEEVFNQDKLTKDPSYISEQKKAGLKSIITAYNQLKTRSKIISAIKNEEGILNSACVYEIDLLATPYEKNYPRQSLYYNDTPLESSSSDEGYFGMYRPMYITMSDDNEMDFSLPEEYIRLRKYIIATFSKAPSTYLSRQLEIVDIWGSIIEGRQLNETKYYNFKAFEKYYQKIKYLYDSLVVNGLIENESRTTLYAFLFLLYHVWFEFVENDPVVHNLLLRSSKDEEESYRYLYKQGISFESATLFMAYRSYVLGQNMSILRMMEGYERIYKYIYEEEEETEKKRKHTESLLVEKEIPKGISIEDTDDMTDKEFEKLIIVLYLKQGYTSFQTRNTEVGDTEIFAKNEQSEITIRAKCCNCAVDGNTVQKIVDERSSYDSTNIMIITNSMFTLSARQIAEQNCISLCDRNMLKIFLTSFPVTHEELEKVEFQ